MFKAYSRFLDRLEKLFLMILGLLLAAMTGIMVYQVVLRYLFHRPNVWAEEVVKFLFAWVCFVGAPVCMRRNSHLKVDFLLLKLPESIRYLWQSVIVLLSIAFAAVIVPISIPMVRQVVGQYSLGAHVPMWIPYLSVPFGGVFLVVFGVELFFKTLEAHLRVTGKKAGEP
ncbi:MAG: TRAP transporter small permease [Angelakisella sp.]|nr:TRAP transporter small permease [Angelakisella sp.]